MLAARDNIKLFTIYILGFTVVNDRTAACKEGAEKSPF
jgi:hypothetical protein